MSLNESIVEDAALTWFGELGVGRVKSEMGRVKFLHPFPISLFTLHSFSCGPQLAPGEPASERDSFGGVVLVGRLRGALRRLVCFSGQSALSAPC